MDQHARLERATADLDAPFAVVDLDAFDANAADLERRAAGTPLRLASKSVRCRALTERVLARPGWHGVLALTLPEALWLASRGTSDDLVVGYPTADRGALRALAEGPHRDRVTVMVDDVAQLDLVRACGATAERPVGVCLDVDAALRLGPLHVGVRRSPVRTPAQAAALAAEVRRRPELELRGLMAYEAQVAGLGDVGPDAVRQAVVRILQWLSLQELRRRRARLVRAVGPVGFVNGGGTGSVERTARDGAVTEIAAGSGLYGPALFDAYRAFRPRPAALFAVPVVRRPGPGVVTALGGGLVASGAAGADRLPRPTHPAGLRLDPREGAGEAQTPLHGPAADGLAVGDRVWLRHAKAGELCERFDELHLVAGDRVVDVVPTYRGEGRAFL